uniref:Uncharacterized protein n=1 Tax=viral metagenome TaxID=1070528 RepID=A0A6C0DSX2_9ZZZZ
MACPEGTVERKSYTRKNGRYVRSTCVKKTRKNSSSNSLKHISSCPPGYVTRKSYTRHMSNRVRQEGYLRKTAKGSVVRVFPKQNTKFVQSSCILDKGKKGKALPGTKIIGPLKQGELKKYGYSFRLPEHERHSALLKAIRAYGALETYHKLNAVSKLTARTVPKASSVFTQDKVWIQKTHM